MVTEELPFDESTLVFKVAGRMFALTDMESEFAVTLKCDPDYAVELREKFSHIKGAYHMNKVHWNTVYDASLTDEQLLKDLIDHSYDLVVLKLPLKIRKQIIG